MGLFDKLKQPVYYKESSDAKAQLEHLKTFQDNAPADIKKLVEQDIKFLSYGIVGEEQVAFELMNSFMPIIILHDLHYEYEGLSAQIDYLVITQKVIIVIECKNLFGNIEVNNNGDFIRTLDFGGKKKKEGIYSPITQNHRHLELLKKIRKNSKSILEKLFFDKWFDSNYKSIVVLANPKTVINMKFAKKEVKEQIIRCDQLIDRIKKINTESQNSNQSEKTMYEIAEIFLSYHTPNTNDYTNKYKVGKIETESIQPVSIQAELIQSSNEIQEPTVQKMKDAEEKSSIQDAPGVEVKYPILAYPVSKDKPSFKVNNTISEAVLIKNNIGLNIEETPIYQDLKSFRYNKSKEERVKAYFIFNNAQLEQLISMMPRTLKDINLISGFGDVKCQKYGKDILKIIEQNR